MNKNKPKSYVKDGKVYYHNIGKVFPIQKKETMNKLINGYSCIEVPSDARVFYLITGGVAGKKIEIIGKKLSEDEWRKIVANPIAEDEGFSEELYFNYYRNSQNQWPYIFTTATESGLSLLKSLNLLDKYERGEILILKEKK